MFMFFMFACSLAFMFAIFAFPLLVLAELVFALAGEAATFAFAAVFELLAVAQPTQKTVAVSRIRKAVVRSIEVPPMYTLDRLLVEQKRKNWGLLDSG
jgi:hypothetical protein